MDVRYGVSWHTKAADGIWNVPATHCSSCDWVPIGVNSAVLQVGLLPMSEQLSGRDTRALEDMTQREH